MLKIILAYASIYVVWGSTYFFIKEAVRTIPSWYVVCLRFTTGGLLLFSIAWGRGSLKKIPPLNEILSAGVLGILLLIGGNGLVTIAEKRVDSYIAALIVATTPIFVMGIDLALFGQRVRLINWLGAAIGIPGVALLLFDGRSGVPVITFHLALLFGAVFFWSLGTSLSKRMTLPRDTLLNSGIQMSVAGVVSLFVAQIQQPVQSVAWQAVSPGSWVGVAFLAVIGSLAYCSFAYLCAHEPNYRIVTYALVNPLIAVYIGLYIGSETMVPYLFPGMGAILTGLFLMFYGERLTEWAVRRNQES